MHQLAVARPILRMAVMRNVLQLIEGARVEQHEAENSSQPLVQPGRTEDCPVAQLMLARIQKVEQHAVHDEYGHGPGSAPEPPQQRPARAGRAHMRQRLEPAAKIGGPAQSPQPRRAENIASGKNFLHAAPPATTLADSIAVF